MLLMIVYSIIKFSRTVFLVTLILVLYNNRYTAVPRLGLLRGKHRAISTFCLWREAPCFYVLNNLRLETPVAKIVRHFPN